jgi:hypothetical protein
MLAKERIEDLGVADAADAMAIRSTLSPFRR